jgi:hypothetical protein
MRSFAVQLAPTWPTYLRAFLQDTARDLGNLGLASLPDKHLQIGITLRRGLDASRNRELAVLLVDHHASPPSVAFIREHAAKLGRQPIFTSKEGRFRAHRGLFFLGRIMAGLGAEFGVPAVLDGDRICWSFRFPVER